MSNKKFGYARVSTTDQNEDRQVLDLMEYGIDERDIYVDKQSGRSFERTNYLALRNTILRDGDVLVVKSIDRFGRNYSAIRTEWEYLTKTLGVDIVVLDTPISGYHTIQGPAGQRHYGYRPRCALFRSTA